MLRLGKLDGVADADRSWVGLSEPHKRLQWARRRLFSTGAAFAASLGWQDNTYTAYERDPAASKATRLTAEKAMDFARRLKVRWEWLLYGTGEPWVGAAQASGSARSRLLQEIQSVAEDETEDERLLDVIRAVRTARQAR